RDGAVQIELRSAIAAQVAQGPQRDLELADVELAVAAVVRPATLGRHAHRAAAPARPPHADSPGGAARVAERARATGAHPVSAAVVPLALLGQALRQLAPQVLVGDTR